VMICPTIFIYVTGITETPASLRCLGISEIPRHL
jgi:hypothetical protein